MKVDENALEIARENQDVLTALVDHFKYSVNDIESYDELTESEKAIISKEVFSKIINRSEVDSKCKRIDELKSKYKLNPLSFTVKDLIELGTLLGTLTSDEVNYIENMMSCFSKGMNMIAINPNSSIDKIVTERYQKLRSNSILRTPSGLKFGFLKYDINDIEMYDCVESKVEDLLLVIHPSHIARFKHLISDVDPSEGVSRLIIVNK